MTFNSSECWPSKYDSLCPPNAHEQNKTINGKNKNGPSGPTKLGREVPGLKNGQNRPGRGVPCRNGFGSN